MRNVTKEILSFAEFLDLNWTNLTTDINSKFIDEFEKARYIQIWLQANWEIQVEMMICKEDNDCVLDYYGEGADLYDLSYRVIHPEKKGNSRIVAYSETPLLDELQGDFCNINFWAFYKFISFKDGNYYEAPPFNYVLIEDMEGKSHVFKKEELKYFHILNTTE